MPFPKPKIEQPQPILSGLTGDPLATEGEPGDGTQQSGYVSSDIGPFECQNCTHFQAPGTCDHPKVVSDPEVGGQVEPAGCCNFFKSASSGAQQAGDDIGAPAVGVAEEQA